MSARFRRLRKNRIIRHLVRETTLSVDDFIQPFFVVEGRNKRISISSMPGIYRYSVDYLLKAIERYQKAGGQAGLFFGLPEKKDLLATQAYASNGIIPRAVKAIKKAFPDFVVITDVCLCAYMTHGHCGVIHHQDVDNDKTLPLLTKMAISHAEAGADIVAPSDMMDGRIEHMRQGLDRRKLHNTLIMSYAVKYASAFYGPFRDAADSGAQFGDRKTYQMDVANQREALKEARRDIQEGADLVMVKPALAYMDIIALLKKELTVPVVAYSVSGEYSMMKAAAQKKWIQERDVVLESFISMKRSGADIIITYYAQQVFQWLK